MKTTIPSLPGIERQWHVIDAEEAVLGRIASKAAKILMGKHKPTYTPFIDTGDHVIVVNAAKVKLTGKQRRTETLSPALGISGRLNRNFSTQGAGSASHTDGGRSSAGHAPQKQDGEANVPQAASLRRSDASAPGAESQSHWLRRKEI